MDIQVGILDDRFALAKIGQEAELIIVENRGFNTESGPAQQEGVDVGGIVIVLEGAIIRLNLARDAQLMLLVG